MSPEIIGIYIFSIVITGLFGSLLIDVLEKKLDKMEMREMYNEYY